MGSITQPICPVVCSECGRTLPTRQGLRLHLRKCHNIVEVERECSICRVVKDSSFFGVVDRRIGSNGQLLPRYRSECDECRRVKHERQKERTAARPKSHLRRDRKKHTKKFGLLPDQYDRVWADFLESQGGFCAVCLKRPPTALDHCHRTGRLRGLLCRQCNLAAGFLGDDPETAKNMVFYLERAQ